MVQPLDQYYEHLPQGGPKHLVLLLHGVGANGQDLIGLAPLLAQALPDAAFVSPDAPFPYDMAPPEFGVQMRQWFSLQDRTSSVMLEEVERAAPVLETFIDEQLKRFNLRAQNLVLVGFSQGTMMSLYTGPRYKNPIAAILGYSGSLIGGEGFAEDPDEFQRPLIHLIHGEADDVVPVEAWHQAKETLTQAGFTVTGETTPGLGHSIDEAGIASGSAFLRSVFTQ